MRCAYRFNGFRLNQSPVTVHLVRDCGTSERQFAVAAQGQPVEAVFCSRVFDRQFAHCGTPTAAAVGALMMRLGSLNGDWCLDE